MLISPPLTTLPSAQYYTLYPPFYTQYAGNCPEIFTEEHMRNNFPNTDLAPWDIIESFGPTPSGAQGYTVQIPEMDKVSFRPDHLSPYTSANIQVNVPICT